MTLVWFYRLDAIARSPGVTRRARRHLRNRGITLVAIPFIASHFPVPWYLLPVVLPQLVLGLAWVRFVRGKRILHCRSHHAALAGVTLKRILPITVVFDPRSPFAEEQVAAGKWNESGRNYLTWKAAERWICRSSDRIIATSQPFAESLTEAAPASRIVVIPNNYPRAFDETNPLPRTLATTLCYTGSLGHWNRPEPYVRFLQALERSEPGLFNALFVVPESSRRPLESALGAGNSPITTVSIQSADQSEVLELISPCTVGMQLMDVADDRLSIKAVEYLAAGLPIVVSENVRGAAAVVRKYDVGFVLQADFGNVGEAAGFIHDVTENRDLWGEKCRRVALERFSTAAVANQLASVYTLL